MDVNAHISLRIKQNVDPEKYRTFLMWTRQNPVSISMMVCLFLLGVIVTLRPNIIYLELTLYLNMFGTEFISNNYSSVICNCVPFKYICTFILVASVVICSGTFLSCGCLCMLLCFPWRLVFSCATWTAHLQLEQNLMMKFACRQAG